MAAGDFVGIDIRGMEQVNHLLRNLPREAQDAASQAVAEYMLRVERAYPPYQYITRKQAYPPTGWQSDRQRRFVMAAIREGRITPGSPHRTQAFSRAWRIVDRGVNAFLVNETPYGPYLKDPRANHMKLIGWTTIEEDVEKRQPEILRKAQAGIDKAIRKLGG